MKSALILVLAVVVVVGTAGLVGATVRVGGTTAGLGLEYQRDHFAVSTGLGGIETFNMVTGDTLTEETTLGVGMRYILPTGTWAQPYLGAAVDLFGNFVKAEVGFEFTAWRHLSIRPGLNLLYIPTDGVRRGNTQLLPGVGISLQL